MRGSLNKGACLCQHVFCLTGPYHKVCVTIRVLSKVRVQRGDQTSTHHIDDSGPTEAAQRDPVMVCEQQVNVTAGGLFCFILGFCKNFVPQVPKDVAVYQKRNTQQQRSHWRVESPVFCILFCPIEKLY